MTLYHSLPNPGLPSQTGILAGAMAAAAAAGPPPLVEPPLPSPPQLRLKSTLVEPLAIPLPFPGRTPANLAGIWPTRAGQPRQDHIAKKIFFPGSLLQKRN
jgi:hypothetical protein